MSDLTKFQRKSIAVLGFGVNNRELAAYLLRNGLPVTLRDSDASVKEKFEAAYARYGDLVTWDIRTNIFEKLEDFDVLFRTPGTPAHRPELVRAAARGATITSQTQLFMELCPAITVGVTGTKGKGTTSSLMHSMLSRGYAKGKTYLAGNIGVDPFSFIDDLREDDIVILELSSFQLEDLRLSPHVAVLLRVAADHLDHHRSLDEYRAAKANLIAHQNPNDIAVVNAEYPEMAAYLQHVHGKLLQYTRHQPRQQSGWAERLEGREVIFLQFGSSLESIDITERKLLGDHNLENILPAAIVAAHFRVPPAVIQKSIVEFAGLEHRLSLVGEFGGVSFYDDSIATTPESSIVAMEAFEGRRLHVIAGGKDKGQEHGAVASEMAARCVTVSLMPGAATAGLRKELEKRTKTGGALVLPNAAEPVMETILSGIHPHLQPGDVVLLAPAAASDAPFYTYKVRGEAFAEAVIKRYGGSDGSR